MYFNFERDLNICLNSLLNSDLNKNTNKAIENFLLSLLDYYEYKDIKDIFNIYLENLTNKKPIMGITNDKLF